MHRRGGTRTQIHTTGELSGAAAPGTPRYPFPPSTRQVPSGCRRPVRVAREQGGGSRWAPASGSPAHLDDDTEGSIANELLVSQLDFLHPAHLALHLCSPDRGPGSTEPHCYSKIKKPGF
jgi:hypothetical protein